MDVYAHIWTLDICPYMVLVYLFSAARWMTPRSVRLLAVGDAPMSSRARTVSSDPLLPANNKGVNSSVNIKDC